MIINDTLNEIDAILQVAARNGEIHPKWRDEIELRTATVRSQLMNPTLKIRQAEIIESLYGLHLDMARGTDDQRRELTKMMAQQFAFEYGREYGIKSADPTRPPSKDAIAIQFLGRLYSWDWQNGTTREPQVRVGQEAEDITGQNFIPVEPFNYLGDNGDTNNPPDNPPEDDEQLAALLQTIIDNQHSLAETQSALISAQVDILQRIDLIAAKADVKFPDYEIKGNRYFNALFGTVTATKK